MNPKDYIVHCKKAPYDVYIGRPSEWGNPYSHLPDTVAEFWVPSRKAAVQAYERWIRSRPDLMQKAKAELKGKTLGCWCGPTQACHGDVLVKIANEG